MAQAIECDGGVLLCGTCTRVMEDGVCRWCMPPSSAGLPDEIDDTWKRESFWNVLAYTKVIDGVEVWWSKANGGDWFRMPEL